MKKYFTFLLVLICVTSLYSEMIYKSYKYVLQPQYKPTSISSANKGSTSLSETTAEPPANFNETNAGTETNPFLISNLANLRWLSETQEYWGNGSVEYIQPHYVIIINSYYYYSQTADIDASETISWNNGLGFNPIGLSEPNVFVGNYNGNGFSINHLNINRLTSNTVALFGYTLSSTIQNLNLNNVNIIGYNYVGALTAYNFYTRIENCNVSGEIAGNDWLGSIAGGMGGFAWGAIERSLVINCNSSANIIGQGIIEPPSIGGTGGIVGMMNESDIKNSSFSGTIVSVHSTGGILGVNMYSQITNCFSTGNIASSFAVGGVTGISFSGEIKESWSYGTIVGDSDVGGITGYAIINGRNAVENCFSTSHISGNSNVGGLVGTLEQSSGIINSYFFGDIEVTGNDNTAGGLVGALNGGNIRYCYVTSRNHFVNSPGLVGNVGDNSSVRNSFLDTETTGTTDLFGQIGTNTFIVNNFGVPTTEMKEQSTYINNGWNFNDLWSMDSNTNEGYPYLQSNPINSFFPPRNLTYVRSANSITLSWDAPINRGVLEKYFIYKDGVMIDFTLVGSQTFIDNNLINDIEYTYYVTAVYTDPNGESVPSNSVTVMITVSDIDETILPIQTELVGNYPNPFNPETALYFKLANNSRVVIDVFNIRGQIVKLLVDEYLTIGEHNVLWNGIDDMGRSVTSGVYYYRMTTDDIVQTKRMVLLK